MDAVFARGCVLSHAAGGGYVIFDRWSQFTNPFELADCMKREWARIRAGEEHRSDK